MGIQKSPRLRTVDKVKPPYPLNQFPTNFAYNLGKEIVYLLATKSTPTLEGEEWEEIFADCVGAEWTPSNVGLDDVRLGVCAWGAKTVKARNPHEAASVRLISGRNSPIYSFNNKELDRNPDELGSDVLRIWNGRVEALRSKFSHLRTVVLVKSDDLTKLTVFEIETVLYPTDNYYWAWNKRKNLEGYDSNSKQHKFTWQPHGSQFTIIENIPTPALLIEVKRPEHVDKNAFLQAIKFDRDWIKVNIRK
ncbi:MAG: hypothetical protein ACOYZ6_01870 [Chloroflexota bacterium]